MDIIKSSGIIIIEDHFECRGIMFLTALLKNILKTVNKVLIICTELNQLYFLDSCNEMDLKKLEFSLFIEDLNLNERLANSVSAALNNYREKMQTDTYALVIDSLFPVVINFGTERTIQWLNTIHKNTYLIFNFLIFDLKVPILSIVHSDCFNSDQINQLQWLATTWYKVKLCEKSSKILLDSRTIKTSGEVRRKSSVLNISNKFAISLSNVGSIDVHKISQPTSLNDKNTNLTFNVGIKHSELSAKQNLILPYIKSQSEKETGQVIYVPDKEDDFDEEDPDADLDF